MIESVKTYRTILFASTFYVEDIEAVSQEAAEAKMRDLWEQCSITSDGCTEEITSIEAAELERPEITTASATPNNEGKLRP